MFIYGSCYPRQAYIKYFDPYLELPNSENLPEKAEFPFDLLKSKDEDNIFSLTNSKLILEFKKQANKEDKNDLCFSRKIIIGNCKLLDPKMEKNCNFEISIPVQ